MKFLTWRWLTAGAAAVLLLLLMGCGKTRNLEFVEPDFSDPTWYDDFKADRSAAYDRYDGKVIQLSMQVTDLDESESGLEVTGTTGDEGHYRVSCIFSDATKKTMPNVREGSLETVKGLFDHMQELSNSYKIYLKNCVIVER